jgi:hypothetical protein
VRRPLLVQRGTRQRRAQRDGPVLVCRVMLPRRLRLICLQGGFRRLECRHGRLAMVRPRLRHNQGALCRTMLLHAPSSEIRTDHSSLPSTRRPRTLRTIRATSLGRCATRSEIHEPPSRTRVRRSRPGTSSVSPAAMWRSQSPYLATTRAKASGRRCGSTATLVGARAHSALAKPRTQSLYRAGYGATT